MTPQNPQLKKNDWQKMNTINEDVSLMTPIGVAQGDALFYLEQKGSAYVCDMATHLEWPTPVMMLAAGALIRDGLVKAKTQNGEIVLESV